MNEYGENSMLYYYRLQLGLSSRGFARRIGIPVAQYRDYEEGSVEIPLEVLHRARKVWEKMTEDC